MSDKILQSVIEITRQRDLDSLEYSLATTLAEMVPAQSISIYRKESEMDISEAVEVVKLTVSEHGDGDTKYTWSSTPTIIDDDPQLEKCMDSMAPLHYTLESGLTRLIMPVLCDGHTIGALSIGIDADIDPYRTLIEAFTKIYANYLTIFNESERDKLTGLYNRRTFDNKLRRLFTAQKFRKDLSMRPQDIADRRHTHAESSAWLGIFDIDHFKKINDSFGHVFGDEVLLTISHKLRECFRSSDLLFRIGGEEFVVILEPVNKHTAHTLFDNFRKTIAAHLFSQIDAVTISIGYAKIMERDYPPEILERADKALYYAKDHGRNCIYNYERLIKDKLITPQKKSGTIDIF